MSVIGLMPEGDSPPPEPPPKDYYINNNIDNNDDNINRTIERVGRDAKIKARIEACRQGMVQLDALRSKHHKLMQEMRCRLPAIPGEVEVLARAKKIPEFVLDRSSLQSVDSGISSIGHLTSTRSSSPSISHRSSLSCDSSYSIGIISDVNSSQPMTYSTYRKLSLEEKNSVREEMMNYKSNCHTPVVATIIASTTCNSNGGRPIRPRSMYDTSIQRSDLVDSASFCRITPPVQRKFGIVVPGQTQVIDLSSHKIFDSVSTQKVIRTPQKPIETKTTKEYGDVVFHASRVYVGSPERRHRPLSLLEDNRDEPLYATPARVIIRDRSKGIAPSPHVIRRSAFAPINNNINISSCELRATRVRIVEKSPWRESEGL